MTDTPKVCSVYLCDRTDKLSRGLCNLHYKRWYRTGNPLGKLPGVPSRKQVGCKIEECKNPHNAKGWCYTHYFRWKRTGDPLKLIEKGWHIDNNGYIKIMNPDNPKKTILQHRFIMQEHLGKKLERHEHIHHKNGNRQDNRLENLEIWSTHQPAGQRIEDKVNYALEILNQYAPQYLKETTNEQCA